MHEVILRGCRPDPLASYLKALGVMRLVCEQADPEARGAWLDEHFVLRSSMDAESLQRFFAERYRPTPLLAPWNGGSGFYYKWKNGSFGSRRSESAIEELRTATHPRFQPIVNAIRDTSIVLRQLAVPIEPAKQNKAALDSMLLLQLEGRPFAIAKEGKEQILRALRARLPDDQIRWLDAAVTLQDEGQLMLPLLGSGGNDGNLEFSVNSLQHLMNLFPLGADEDIPTRTRDLLAESLFANEGVPLDRSASPGQFDPGGGGGPNAGQGFTGGTLLNPWDYVLMLEGALLFAGSVSRRNSTGGGRATLPFTVDVTPSGLGSLVKQDESLARAEMWLPLWKRQFSLGELGRLLAEGRAQAGRSQAATGLDFARAVTGLGVDRGIAEFVRYVFLQRSGRMFIAVPVGRYRVREPTPENHLLDKAARWLSKASELAARKEIPASVRSAVSRAENAVFRYCSSPCRRALEDVLASLGGLERAIARSPKGRESIRPLAGLSFEWRRKTAGDRAETRIAAALASIQGPAIRCHLEPVEESWHDDEVSGKWSGQSGPEVVWSGDDLSSNLARIFARRVLNATRENAPAELAAKGRPLAPFRAACTVPLTDIVSFLAGELDEERISDLVWAYAATAPEPEVPDTDLGEPTQAPPATYALLKLCFLPEQVTFKNREPLRIGPDHGLARLITADCQRAIAHAIRKLRAAGFIVRGSESRRGQLRDLKFLTSRCSPVRLAAALLIPIAETRKLADLVLRREEETITPSMEPAPQGELT